MNALIGLAEPTTSRVRIRMVDAVRLLAIAQMVQGHTIDAVLADPFRSGSVHSVWTAARGLTSVAFLFLAGLSFHLASQADAGASGRRRRCKRALSLVLLGYALHLPVAWVLGKSSAAGLTSALIVDVLQCIGVSLIVLEATDAWLASPRARSLFLCALAAGLLWVQPYVATLEPAGAFRLLTNYVSTKGGSIFPVVPYGVHVLLGGALAPWVLSSTRRPLRLALAAAVLAIAAFACEGLQPSAASSLARISAVVLLCGVVACFERSLASMPKSALSVSRQSLFVYVAHIVLVYGDAIGLSHLVGPRLGPWPSVAVAALMLVTVACLALAYDRMRSLPARPVPAQPVG